MNLTDLKTENPQAAVEQMCGMDNAEMDRVAAELQGWELEPDGWYTYLERNSGGIKGRVRRLGVEAREYRPSVRLDDSYELLELVCKKRSMHWQRTQLLGVEETISWELRTGAGKCVSSFVEVFLEDAGSHARAVTILACVGLLFGGKQ